VLQVTLERFTLGRFNSFLSEGCPDGYLALQEKSRSSAGGLWCGTSWGPVIYFSETTALTLSVTLLKLSSNQNGYNFDFKISYKMLPKSEAVVRFGEAGVDKLDDDSNSVEQPYLNSSAQPEQHYLGNRIGTTYCSRMFSDCDRKQCRLQSPNYPGVYPRNLTCYYAVRQQSVPQGKHALIAVSQPHGQLINIRSQSALYARPTQSTSPPLARLKVWKECDEVQDYVTVYDGYTTRDPVLLKFCGGGSQVPRTVSSGPELLVEFSSSPFGTFLYPAPLQALHGFQLKVDVEFVEREEPIYTRNKRCEFWISGNGNGVLESPHNSIPPNTTCLYHLWGSEPGATPLPRPQARPPRYRVWLSVLNYHVASLISPTLPEDTDCNTSLKIWDGTIKSTSLCNHVRPNVALLGRYCKEEVPRSCDHYLLKNASRPCTLTESFLSTGDSLTLELTLAEATSLRPVSFRALYEFVDLHQDGEPFGTGPCSRIFTSRYQLPSVQHSPQNFASPREIFLYGRGGAKNLSCVHRFEGQKGERVRLTINSLRNGNRTDCSTLNKGGWGRLHCIGQPTAFIQFWEIPFAKSLLKFPKDCMCATSEISLPFVYSSNSHILELHFVVNQMDATDDYRKLGFEGTWEFTRKPVCTRDQNVRGASGELVFSAPSRTTEEVNCEGQPWVIVPSDSRYLYVKTMGVIVGGTVKPKGKSERQCITSNRIEIHAGETHVIVCPTPVHQNNIVEVFSDGWVIKSGTSAERLPPEWARFYNKELRDIAVEFIAKEKGSYVVSWLELSRRRADTPGVGHLGDCPHRCPELDACINSSLWCDGTYHCPTGYDESASHCLPLPPIQLALLAIIVISAVSLVITLLCRLRKPRRHLKSLPSDTDTIMSSSAGKEVIC
ncbi:hypothetical protein AAG570_000558, partial [Ranatra chinensis]